MIRKAGPGKKQVKKAAVSQTASSFGKLEPWLLPLILILVFFLYLNSLKNGFVNWDDPDYVLNNPDIQGLGIQHLKAIFAHFYVANWQPLTILSYAVEYAIAGTRSAFLYHFDNLLLHLANIILVYYFIRRLSGKSLVAAITAFLFGIHPMHVESVAWVSERKDVLYTFFFMASLILYLKYLDIRPGKEEGLQGKKPGMTMFYLLSIVLFLLSLMSKPAAVVLPLVLVLLDFYLGRRFNTRLVVEKIPFFLFAILTGLITLHAQKGAIVNDLALVVTPFQRVVLVNFGFFKYIFMMFIPAGMSTLHSYPSVHAGTFDDYVYIIAFLNIIILATFALGMFFSRKMLFGILFYLITIVLVLQFLPVGSAIISERYTYVPYIGLFFILAFDMVRYLEKKTAPVFRKSLLIFVFAVYACGLMASAWQRTTVWINEYALWDDVINKYPDRAFKAYFLRGEIKAKRGDEAGALEDYNKSLSINPKFFKSLNNRANVYNHHGRFKEAIQDYDMALSIDSTEYLPFGNRAVAKANLADTAGALHDFNKCLKLKPDYWDGWRNRGILKLTTGHTRAAIEDWKAAAANGDSVSQNLIRQHIADIDKKKTVNVTTNIRN